MRGGECKGLIKGMKGMKTSVLNKLIRLGHA